MIVGILAFHGDVQEHRDVLSKMRVHSLEVRTVSDLAKVDALIIPGGESTVIAQFLEETGAGKDIARRAGLKAEMAGKAERAGLAVLVDTQNFASLPKPLIVYGTCAGAILLAKKVTGKNAPKTLGLIDVAVDRNAYGTQIDSFEAELKISGIQKPVPVAFIRAPKITAVGKGVEVLAKFRSEPVLVRQGNVMIGTFHAEVRDSDEIHRMFLSMAR